MVTTAFSRKETEVYGMIAWLSLLSKRLAAAQVKQDYTGYESDEFLGTPKEIAYLLEVVAGDRTPEGRDELVTIIEKSWLNTPLNMPPSPPGETETPCVALGVSGDDFRGMEVLSDSFRRRLYVIAEQRAKEGK